MPAQTQRSKPMIRFMILAAAAAAVAACATIGPIPADRLAATEASYRGAQEAGADSVPQAKLHLKFAGDGIIDGRRLINAQNNVEAVRVLDRARADAELAVVLPREAQSQWDAQQAAEQAKTLRANP